MHQENNCEECGRSKQEIKEITRIINSVASTVATLVAANVILWYSAGEQYGLWVVGLNGLVGLLSVAIGSYYAEKNR